MTAKIRRVVCVCSIWCTIIEAISQRNGMAPMPGDVPLIPQYVFSIELFINIVQHFIKFLLKMSIESYKIQRKYIHHVIMVYYKINCGLSLNDYEP